MRATNAIKFKKAQINKMDPREIPQIAIDAVAQHINERTNKFTTIPIITIEANPETPHYFEIVPFDKIDESDTRFYAVDGSYNSQDFYNGLSIGIYSAGYVCYLKGHQLRLNTFDDSIILGKAYYPQNILITNETHCHAVFDELLDLQPVKNLISFFNSPEDDIWGWGGSTKDTVCNSLSKLFSFCQEVLEWALVLEIANNPDTMSGDIILRDGTLRSNNIKQKHLVKLGRHLHNKGIYILAITKNSPIKLELSSAFKKIDNYLQEDLRHTYPFTIANKERQKLCCWFEVSDDILDNSYKNDMFARKGLTGGRGFGHFFAARLDYVEKLQNYDWVIIDVNIFDSIPEIESSGTMRDIDKLKYIFSTLTRLTQEHYILGYPYPLVEAHNFISLKHDFKDEVIKRVRAALYHEQRMDNVDIENLFLDIHERF
jgi:hypothetical protein